jgi:hypothetical protein
MFDKNPASFWHSAYSGAFISTYPHWFIIDMHRSVTITQMMIQRRLGVVSFKGCYIYTCPDVAVNQDDHINGYPWELLVDYEIDPLSDAENWIQVSNLQARYIYVYFDPKHKAPTSANNYVEVSEFGVYGYY